MKEDDADRAVSFKEAIRGYEWAKAEDLASNEQERRDVAESKLRVQEMEALKAAQKYADALRLAITQSEVDELMEMLSRREKSLFASCFKMPPPPMRSLEFVEAIRKYDWPLASELARTEGERRDVEDSIARVDQMLKLKAVGRYSEALVFAIHQSEVDELRQLQLKYPEPGGVTKCVAACLGKAPPPPVRSPEFIEAIRTYNWTEADRLVSTLEEKQDLEDSIVRSEKMEKCIVDGKYDDALKLAILTSEATRIIEARKRAEASAKP